MKKQRNQVIALVVLLILWAVSWKINKLPATPPSIIKTKAAAKAVVGDTLLMTRFHRVRGQMDALYHYRVKPVAFDSAGNPFRIPGVRDTPGDLKAPRDQGPPPPGFAESLLKQAVAGMRFGGVVTMNGTTQLTVDGQLHKEGDSFAARVKDKLVLIKVRSLSTYAVTLGLEDSESGDAEIKVRLK